MEADFCKSNPSRSLNWRADRAVHLAEGRVVSEQSASFDDRCVRAYRRLLLARSAAGGDENKDYSVFCEMPHIYAAQQMHYCPDTCLPRLMEAWLLTGATSGEIATHLKTEEPVVDWYEQLFFDVRDRLHRKDWVTTIIFDPRLGLCLERNGRMSDDQQSFMYRLFGYYGGPSVLEALIAGAAPKTLPPDSATVPTWFDDVLAEIAQFQSSAVQVLTSNRTDVLELLERAVPTRSRS